MTPYAHRAPRRASRSHAAGLVAALLTLAACGGGDKGTVAPEAVGGGPPGAVVVGTGVQFVSRHNGTSNPAVDTVAVGDLVTWQWSGTMPHDVRWIDAPGQPDSPVLTGSGTFTATFAAPGTYHYDCSLHGNAMTGTLVVTAR
jgi:plastocyanin